MTRSRLRAVMSSTRPMRAGMHLKNQMCETGTASSMCPMRSRRTRASVTSTPQRSQTTPRCLIRLYLPQEHSQSLPFLDQHVEGSRHASLQAVLAFHDALVNARAALHVVRLDGQQFLQGVSRAIGFHGPDFHFTDPLSAVLGLPAQRLLRD